MLMQTWGKLSWQHICLPRASAWSSAWEELSIQWPLAKMQIFYPEHRGEHFTGPFLQHADLTVRGLKVCAQNNTELNFHFLGLGSAPWWVCCSSLVDIWWLSSEFPLNWIFLVKLRNSYERNIHQNFSDMFMSMRNFVAWSKKSFGFISSPFLPTGIKTTCCVNQNSFMY